MNGNRISNSRLPEFIIIGAPKAGSTTLYKYLCRHPDIYMCTPKEPHFFSHPDVWERGLQWYQMLFADASTNQLCGEASTTYARWPQFGDVASKIAQIVPKAKLIYIMRHPIDRAYSHYGHHMRSGVTMTFEEALEKESAYVNISLYMNQIKQYLNYFKKSSIHFVIFEELKASPEQTLNDLQKFLGLEIHNLVEKGMITANKGGAEHYLWFEMIRVIETRQLLVKVKKIIPSDVRKKLFTLFKLSPIGRRMQNSYYLPPMKPETRDRLLNLFHKPNEELAYFLERNLSLWSC